VVFERYTESARRALFFARFETSQLRARSITPEHLLLGILRETRGIAAQILRRANVSYDRIAHQLEGDTLDREPVPTSVEIPFSPEMHDVLHLTMEEADDLGHTHIGTEHLLLGILRKDQARAAAILRRHAMTLDNTREQVRLMSVAPAQPSRPDVPTALEQLAALEPLIDRLARANPGDAETHALEIDIASRLKAIRDLLQ
jgi:ATP-dependent Clp protease ATP-binding subunit ClpC